MYCLVLQLFWDSLNTFCYWFQNSAFVWPFILLMLEIIGFNYIKLFNFYKTWLTFLLHLCLCQCCSGHSHATVCVEGNGQCSLGMALSSCHVGSRNWTQAARLGTRTFCCSLGLLKCMKHFLLVAHMLSVLVSISCTLDLYSGTTNVAFYKCQV